MQAAVQKVILPQTAGPLEVGTEMARLRAGFGLGVAEVSARLHIRPRYISAMEDGKLELLPGKVYARGYVHTYAEFLGIDGDEAVERCFAGEPPANVIQPGSHKSTASRDALNPVSHSRWRGYGVLLVIGLLAALVVSQLATRSKSIVVKEPEVAAVPEDMLAAVRTSIMPGPGNMDCLTTDALLACMYDDVAMQQALQLLAAPPHFLGELDISDLIQPVVQEEEISAPPGDAPAPEEQTND